MYFLLPKISFKNTFTFSSLGEVPTQLRMSGCSSQPIMSFLWFDQRSVWPRISTHISLIILPIVNFPSLKVYWGENAPALYQGAEELVERLVEIGKQNGYSFSMVKTDSQLHGLPQRRVRTFYFFWLSPTVPMLSWYSTEAPRLVDYLDQIPKWASLQDVFVHEGQASERYLPYKFILQKEGMTHGEFVSKKYGKGTVAKYLEKNDLIQECIEWLELHHPKDTFTIPIPGRPSKNRTHIDVLQHMQRKLNMGLGYWDDSIKFMGEAFTAVISKNIAFAVHPTKDRFFSIRELLHLMGMPHDFELENPRRNINHLCQVGWKKTQIFLPMLIIFFSRMFQ